MRKCQSKNPSTCKLHGTGGQLSQLETKSLQAIQEGRTEDCFKIREEIDGLRDEVSPDQKQSFFSRFFGGSKDAGQAEAPTVVHSHVAATPTPVVTPAPEPEVIAAEEAAPQENVEMVPCGKCNSCDPPPSDMTHFSRWSGGGQCTSPVPKQ